MRAGLTQIYPKSAPQDRVPLVLTLVWTQVKVGVMAVPEATAMLKPINCGHGLADATLSGKIKAQGTTPSTDLPAEGFMNDAG
jgi:hypothetical protein